MPSFTWEGPIMCSELCCLGENKDAQRYPHSHLGSIHSKKNTNIGWYFSFSFSCSNGPYYHHAPSWLFSNKTGN